MPCRVNPANTEITTLHFTFAAAAASSTFAITAASSTTNKNVGSTLLNCTARITLLSLAGCFVHSTPRIPPRDINSLSAIVAAVTPIAPNAI